MLYRKLTRRRLLGGSLATAAGLALVSCGGDGDEEEGGAPTPGETPAGEPKRGGTLRTSSTAPILSLDPHETAGVSVAPYFYSYVVHVTDWQGNVGDLAESWETPSETEWIFHLRGDALFHDLPPANGRPLVAEDVVKSIDRYRGMPGASTSWNEWTERYEAPDARTFKETTKKPYGYFLMDLGSPLTAILPVEAVDEFGDLKSHAIGSGPYMLKTHSRDQGMEVVRNPTYYRDFPYVDGVNVRVLPDEASIQAAFRAGSIDVYYPITNKLKADAVRDVSGTTVQKFLDRTYTVLVMNGTKVEAFKDERVREAIDLALDRQAMIDRLQFGDGELAGPVPPLWESALPREEIEAAYKRDVAKAKDLLAAAGIEDLRFPLAFANYQDNPDRAAIIKANLAEVGINVELQGGELGTWIADLMVGSFQATTFGHLRYLSDYIQINSHHSHGWARTPEGYLGVDDDEVDAMLDQVNGTVDDEERIELERDVQRLILKRHGPTLVLYQPYGYSAAYDYVKGYTPTSYGFGLYKYDYWIDKG